MRTLFLSLFLSALLITNAQNKQTDFGTILPEELHLTNCEFEPNAPALVLFDYGESRFIRDETYGFILSFTRHARIKIFDEGGFDQSEIEIHLYKGKDALETVRKIKACSYNWEEGQLKRTELSEDQIFKEKINEYWYMKKFAMPNIKKGTIIEFSYTIESPFYNHFRDWIFQRDIPTAYSEYKVNMIPFYSYRYRLQGATHLHKQKNYERKGTDRSFGSMLYRDMVYEFGLKNIPSFQDESYISSRNDYIKKIDFQLVEINYPSGYKKKYMDTWPTLANDYLDSERFGKYIKKSEKWAKKNASHFTSVEASVRCNDIIDFVKNNYKWNDYFGDYAQLSLKDFQEELSGNIANINLLAIGILRSNGIEADPVIISTRNHGKVNEQFPYSDNFNYVMIIAKIDDRLKLLDATQSFCPNQLIPARCINGKGFVVKEDSEQWVTISNNSPSIAETKLNYTINLDEYRIEGECNRRSTGYIAMDERIDYYNDGDDFKSRFNKHGWDEESDFEVKHLMEEDQPFEYYFNFNQSIDIIDDQIILSPFAKFPTSENPFKQEKRTLPIDMVNKKAFRYNVLITIPEGYKIDALPLNKSIKSDNVEFNYLSQQINPNTIKLYATYNFKKASYPASAYEELKSFMNTVTKKLNSKIVLVKDESYSDLSEKLNQ